MNTDVPHFPNTQAALAYGRSLSLVDFPTLMRTYFVTQRAIAAVPDDALERKLMLALRSQLLREAAEEFLSVARHSPQGEPAAQVFQISCHETAAADQQPSEEVGCS